MNLLHGTTVQAHLKVYTFVHSFIVQPEATPKHRPPKSRYGVDFSRALDHVSAVAMTTAIKSC